MKVCVNLLILLLAVSFVGCAEKKVEKTYELSEVEQLLKDHPELGDAPPEEFRAPGEVYD